MARRRPPRRTRSGASPSPRPRRGRCAWTASAAPTVFSPSGPRSDRSVAGDLAAVDVQDFAGDEGRGLQEENAADDVADLAHMAEGVERAKRLVALRRMPGRLDDARRDGIDPNAVGGVLDGQ